MDDLADMRQAAEADLINRLGVRSVVQVPVSSSAVEPATMSGAGAAYLQSSAPASSTNNAWQPSKPSEE
jgi:hypothetical protein